MRENEYITSDHHFGHANIIKYANRPFKHVDEMDEQMIQAWNGVVPPTAIVYHLGDLAFMRPEQIVRLVRRLHGTIRLVKGNHDKGIKGPAYKAFEWVKDYYESTCDDGTKIVMCHYPFLTWNKAHHGAWMLHGHSHNSLRDTGQRRLDVGVDAHPNYAPFSFAEIAAKMKGREYQSVDHHKDNRRKRS